MHSNYIINTQIKDRKLIFLVIYDSLFLLIYLFRVCLYVIRTMHPIEKIAILQPHISNKYTKHTHKQHTSYIYILYDAN